MPIQEGRERAQNPLGLTGSPRLARSTRVESHTSGKAGGLEKGEPLKAVRYWEPLKAVGS